MLVRGRHGIVDWCRPCTRTDGLLPRHRHAINANRGGHDGPAEFEIITDLRDVEEHVFQVPATVISSTG